MGVPKFYRWISERYPCLSEKIKEYQIPEFDNLYLDMNGIIHNCSHPNDEDIHLRIPEQYIFRDIFRYLDFLFKMIKPRKLFFMAVDGVAPRAKMNQQRGRRFRSAKLAEDQEKEAIRNGEILPTEERFDSNCITPGTEFMAKLQEQLKYFIQIKISTDPLWQRESLVVILSGHDVPGEGEHKIMDYIRFIRSSPDYNPETRHCLYGLDADLMMLGLSCHELRFSLLREEVRFNNRPKKTQKKKPAAGNPQNGGGTTTFDMTNVSIYTNDGGPKTITMENVTAAVSDGHTYAGAISAAQVRVEDNKAEKPFDADAVLAPSTYEGLRNKQSFKPPIPEKTPFYLLHLSLLRDYIDEEFKELREKLATHEKIKYDLEKVIDDWILLSILVGNDFVPHLPKLHIAKGALPLLYGTYINVLPTLDGYINESGILNLPRFEKFLQALSAFDITEFEKDYDDMQWKLSKTNVPVHKVIENFDFGEGAEFEEEALEPELEDELQQLILRSDAAITNGNSHNDLEEIFGKSDELFEDQSPEFKTEFYHHKRDYYNDKLKMENLTREKLVELNEDYIRAICWILLYYYKGVSSWGWYYPHHYAPYISDLREISQFRITFDLGNPFKPFEQLLGVLPAQSKKLLPRVYHDLMTDTKSPIVQYYPDQFEQDLNGKRNDWEAVVLIPFIEEKLLLKAMSERDDMLTYDEKIRNSRGLMFCYRFSRETCGIVQSPGLIFPTLKESHAVEDKIPEVGYNPQTLPKGLHPRARQDVVYQGFPTLKSKPHTGEMMFNAGIKVFDFVAREESLILQISQEDLGCTVNAYNICRLAVGKTVWVNWPHLTLALVTSVSDASSKYSLNPSTKRPYQDPSYQGGREHEKAMKDLEDSHKKFKGITFTEKSVIVWAKPMEGRKVRCNDKGNILYQMQWGKYEQPYPLQTIIFEMDKVVSVGQNKSLSFKDLYQIGQQVFVLQGPYFGFMGTVIGYDDKAKNVKLEFNTTKRDPAEEILNDVRTTDVLRTRRFENSSRAAMRCGLQSFVFNKLTGSIYVSVEKEKKAYNKVARGKKAKAKDQLLSSSDSEEETEVELEEPKKDYKFDIGLNLKFNVRNQEVRGYTRKHDGNWLYSMKTVQLVNEYCSKFTEVVTYLGGRNSHQDVYVGAKIFKENANDKVKEILNWKSEKGISDLEKVPLNSQILDDEDIEVVWKRVNLASSTLEQKCTAFVHPSKLFKPGVDTGCVTALPDLGHNLLDRVICIDPSSTIPLGHLGTIVGIMNPVRTEAENAFSTASESNVQNLLILCDPMKEIFDPAPNQTQSLDAMNLLNMLQIGSKAGSQKPTSLTLPQEEPKCTLIKLYPFQVLNLTKNGALANQPSAPQEKQEELSKLLGGLISTANANSHPPRNAHRFDENQQTIPANTSSAMSRPPAPAAVGGIRSNDGSREFRPTTILQRKDPSAPPIAPSASIVPSTSSNLENEYDASKYVGVPHEQIKEERNVLAKQMFELQSIQMQERAAGNPNFENYTPEIRRIYNRMAFLKTLTDESAGSDIRSLLQLINDAEAKKRAPEMNQQQSNTGLPVTGERSEGEKQHPRNTRKAARQPPTAPTPGTSIDPVGLKRLLDDAEARKHAPKAQPRPQVKSHVPAKTSNPKPNPGPANPNSRPKILQKPPNQLIPTNAVVATTSTTQKSANMPAAPQAGNSQPDSSRTVCNNAYRGNFKLLTSALMGVRNEAPAPHTPEPKPKHATEATTTTTRKSETRKVTLAANFGIPHVEPREGAK